MAMMELKAYQSAALRQPVDNGRPADPGDSRSGQAGATSRVSGDAAGGRDRAARGPVGRCRKDAGRTPRGSVCSGFVAIRVAGPSQGR